MMAWHGLGCRGERDLPALRRSFWLTLLGALAATPACGPGGPDAGAADAGAQGGAAGAAGAAGAGGEGALGGAGGGGAGGGGGGGGSAACLAASEHEAVLDIEEPSLCLVARYVAGGLHLGLDPVTFHTISPTWGAHAGPLVVAPAGEPGKAKLGRWKVPPEPTGKLVPEVDGLALGIATSGGIFLGSQAVDLPFAGRTLVSWTGDFGTTAGEAILLDGSSVAERFPASGLYGAAALGGKDGKGRLLHTGLSPVGAPALGPAGLYAADGCQKGALCDGKLAAAWGDASGPVATDTLGNAFAIQASIAKGEQSLRGFAAPGVAPGAGPSDGQEIFSIPGFGGELAALGPAGGEPGRVFFQPFDSKSFAALDVVVQRYAVAQGSVSAVGAPQVALHMTKAGTAVTLMRDPADRLWVGVATTPDESTFFVLADRP
ncbi:MAG: hypothetical protein HY744_22365 [Deltaproteobacteria bacterium]|nr:hypothetical protein [Deltaproteobacteria bacterium]